MTCRSWYAVHTHALRESLASEQLGRQGFEVFFPRQRKTVRHARRTWQRDISYFPAYVFVALDLQTDFWRRVNGTLGVRSLVTAGDRPARLGGGLIETLRANCDEAGILVADNRWTAGQEVRLLSGPFADQLGVIDRLDGPSRVRVMMSLLGATVPVLTETGNLALAS